MLSGPPAARPAVLPNARAAALRHWPMLRRSLVAGAVVGTALNQGDAIMLGQFSGALAWKIPLTYCVPFLVATYGALSNSRN